MKIPFSASLSLFLFSLFLTTGWGDSFRVSSVPSWQVGIRLDVEGHPHLDCVIHRPYSKNRHFEFFDNHHVKVMDAHLKSRFSKNSEIVLSNIHGDGIGKINVTVDKQRVLIEFEDQRGLVQAWGEMKPGQNRSFQVFTTKNKPILSVLELEEFSSKGGKQWDIDADSSWIGTGNFSSADLGYLTVAYLASMVRSNKLEKGPLIASGVVAGTGLAAVGLYQWLKSSTPNTVPPTVVNPLPIQPNSGPLIQATFNPVPVSIAPTSAPSDTPLPIPPPSYSTFVPPRPLIRSIPSRTEPPRTHVAPPKVFVFPRPPVNVVHRPNQVQKPVASHFDMQPQSGQFNFPQTRPQDHSNPPLQAVLDVQPQPIIASLSSRPIEKQWTPVNQWERYVDSSAYGDGSSLGAFPMANPHLSGDFEQDKSIYDMGEVAEDTGPIYSGLDGSTDPGLHRPQERTYWQSPSDLPGAFDPLTAERLEELADLDSTEFADHNPYLNEIQIYDEMIRESKTFFDRSQWEIDVIPRQLSFMKEVFKHRSDFIRSARGREFNRFERHFSMHNSISDGAFHIELAAEQKKGFKNGYQFERGSLTMRRRLNDFHNSAISTYLKAKRDKKLYSFFNRRFSDGAKCEATRSDWFKGFYRDELEAVVDQNKYFEELWREIVFSHKDQVTADPMVRQTIDFLRFPSDSSFYLNALKENIGKKMMFNGQIFDQSIYDQAVNYGQILGYLEEDDEEISLKGDELEAVVNQNKYFEEL